MLAVLQGSDVILCQITSHLRSDEYSVLLEKSDFAAGGISQSSRIRPNRLFTADESIVLYRAGRVAKGKLDEVLDRLIALLRPPEMP